MSQRPVKLTISLAKHLLQTNQISAVNLVSFCHALAQHGEESLSLNAFSTLLPKSHLLAQAQESQERYDYQQRAAAGKTGTGTATGLTIPKDVNAKSTVRPLEGISVSIKANIATCQSTLTASSHILKETPGYDSHVVQQLQKAGAIIVGVTEMDEFGMGSLGTNATHSDGAARNPLYLNCNHLNQNVDGQERMDSYSSSYSLLSIDHWINHIQSCTISNTSVGHARTHCVQPIHVS